MKDKLFALLFTLALGACGTVGAPHGAQRAAPSSPASHITLPQQIRFQGQNYVLKHQNAISAEYYLQDEQGHQWSRLITVLHKPGMSLREFSQASEKQHRIEKLPLAHIATANGRMQTRSMYNPDPANSRFNSYETNLALAKQEDCGFIQLRHAEQHPASSSAARLAAALAQKQKAFNREAEAVLRQLQCK